MTRQTTWEGDHTAFVEVDTATAKRLLAASGRNDVHYTAADITMHGLNVQIDNAAKRTEALNIAKPQYGWTNTKQGYTKLRFDTDAVRQTALDALQEANWRPAYSALP